MNTELDGPLVVWFGRIMCFIAIFGVMIPVLYFSGFEFIPGVRDDASLGLGAIIASTFGGIGGAFVIKSRAQKELRKMRRND